MNQSQNNSNIGSQSNLRINTDTIIFDRGNLTSAIILSNIHQKYTLYFKIKTKIEKLFDVKPCLGCIKPGKKQMVSFKPLKKIEAEQIANLQQNLLFLLQAVNQLDSQMNKQEQLTLWKQIKTKKTHTQLGYCSVKLGVTFSPKPQKELIPLFAKFQSKLDSRYMSQAAKSIKPVSSSNFPEASSKFSNSSQEHTSDAQLSNKYENLKHQEQQLLKQRQRIFEGPKPKKVKGPSPIKLVIIFLLTFLLGNYLRSVWEYKQPKPKPVEKGFFDWIS